MTLSFYSHVKGAGVAFNFCFANDHYSCRAANSILAYDRGILHLAWLFEEGKKARGRRGAQLITLSRNVYSSLFVQHLHPFLRLRVVNFHFAPLIQILLELYFLGALCTRVALMTR